ncbi:HAD family hydrolase [Flavobacterium johnsoniae]|jgi:putative hydrolase of the HAD superfamily|uniref:HAD-superfamily hydrolase, subfamily IA, variant 3 n=1 Tax=Flavobacterium johnsoniae (strain ATCC 17061 / DSM 2064 / JCM 8514 / BCRC 14874 / CCUG 350202 / NBRC 14942 / NCIMB 11054 / UW101) TaxID=376686 RepID=A5FP25_FLAJ1|nr:HAD family phosphatase [Flavobacterium johnsoniae]ABQ03040.1 HAD-superfamily hydrolase, subfamily IA, variant 3 [Flavobacterium johnsoniae UW101]OXG02132.1 haloacid dehalogenase [Flavobacterium johnsoniae UW101]WQG80097.1 HAD family phosphatase [Flavobacterium johnsoniae UW101]SHK93493.1 putative hydrolase of the HAD superfamily [Flavobacterium johnsoniae]
MIDTIIFDFGDIFINLNKQGTISGLQKLGLKEWNAELDRLNLLFETGDISYDDFVSGFQEQLPNASIEEILEAWNAVLADFPSYRLDFVKELSKKYRLFLLSNTDSIHIATFEKTVGVPFYTDFYNCFEKVHFSFEIGKRKPNANSYQHLIDEHNLVPEQTLFVDDKKENTDAAAALGLHVWNLQVGQEDVVDLFTKGLL